MGFKKWIALMILCISGFSGYAQNTHGDLAVAKYRESALPDLLVKLKPLKNVTARVNLLIKLSSIYNRKKLKDNSNVDSALSYAYEALAISRNLHYQKGFLDATFLICKNSIQKSDLAGATQMLNMVAGEQRVRLLIIIAEHYVFLPGTESKNLKIAFPYIMEALRTSKAIGSLYWHVQSQNLLAKYYYSRGEFSRGKQLYKDIIAVYHKAGDLKAEGHWWSEFGVYMPDNDSTFQEQIQNHQNALAIFHKLKMIREEANTLMNLSSINKLHGHLDEAIAEALESVSLLKSVGERNLYSMYDQLAEMYQDKGNLDMALSYAFLSYNNSVSSKTSQGWYAKAIGNIYRQMGESEIVSSIIKLH